MAAAVLINSFGVVLMLHAGAGISAVSSVPYAFSEVWKRNNSFRTHKILRLSCVDPFPRDRRFACSQGTNP